MILYLGLHLILNIEQSEYIGSLAEAAGVKVVLHHKETMSFPEDNGFSVAPGQMTHIGLTMVIKFHQNIMPSTNICNGWTAER